MFRILKVEFTVLKMDVFDVSCLFS